MADDKAKPASALNKAQLADYFKKQALQKSSTGALLLLVVC